jgi:hypothetical protein
MASRVQLLRDGDLRAEHAPPEALEAIVCRECGHADPAPEGAALLFSMRAPCPACGSRDCELASVPAPIRRVA